MSDQRLHDSQVVIVTNIYVDGYCKLRRSIQSIFGSDGVYFMQFRDTTYVNTCTHWQVTSYTLYTGYNQHTLYTTPIHLYTEYNGYTIIHTRRCLHSTHRIHLYNEYTKGVTNICLHWGRRQDQIGVGWLKGVGAGGDVLPPAEGGKLSFKILINCSLLTHTKWHDKHVIYYPYIIC